MEDDNQKPMIMGSVVLGNLRSADFDGMSARVEVGITREKVKMILPRIEEDSNVVLLDLCGLQVIEGLKGTTFVWCELKDIVKIVAANDYYVISGNKGSEDLVLSHIYAF